MCADHLPNRHHTSTTDVARLVVPLTTNQFIGSNLGVPYPNRRSIGTANRMVVLNQAHPETPLPRSVWCRHHIPNRDLVALWILTCAVQVSFPFTRHDPTIETL
jgi:hypothetical protein